MNSSFRTLLGKKLPFARPLVNALKQQASRRKIARLLSDRVDLRIELGAGDRSGADGWITIDMTNHCDIFWDLRRGIPFPTDSLSKIYSSHFLEHLLFREAQRFLDECRRALMPNGSFSICVPNARLYIDAYVNGKSLDPAHFLAYEPARNRTTRIDYLNYIAYMGGEHRYMFDEENLLFILKDRGFRNVRLRAFDPTIDMQERDFQSIYAEAEK
jgi:predicted SAM-dependent methyltransferase